MKKAELNTYIEKTLSDFGASYNIEVSENWNENLLKKIDSSNKLRLSPISKISLVMFSFVLLINAGFVIDIFKTNSAIEQQKKLQVISNELFINEIQ